MAENGWAQRLRQGPAVLVTGAAGFIGFHLASRLLAAGVAVIGLDNLVPYYDLRLKRARLEMLHTRPGFSFLEIDLADREAVASVFQESRPRHVVHLAAQAGVRYSIDNPFAYADSNLTGFLTVLEGCRHAAVEHLVYASSSSVYGGNTKLPFSTNDRVDHPVSLYAATKKANELMAHTYCHLYGFPATGLRFFTVYGRWGRPDMAYWKFTEGITRGNTIDVYNNGEMARDFTHIDDVITAILRLIPQPATPDPAFDRHNPSPATSWAPHRIYNIGATEPTPLMDMIAILERALGQEARKRFLPMQPGDVRETWADVADLAAAVGYTSKVKLADGLSDFVAWYRDWRATA